MTEPWDGTERRTAVILADDLKPKNTVDAPIILVLVGFAAMLLLQAAAIWSHGQILQNQRDSEGFRRQITCFIVHNAQGETGTSVLTTCGFLNLGAPK